MHQHSPAAIKFEAESRRSRVELPGGSPVPAEHIESPALAMSAGSVDANAMDLLTRVLSLELLQDPLLIQFCGLEGDDAHAAAAAFATAGALYFGRTLLLDARVRSSGHGLRPEAAAERRSVPDAFVPALHHCRLHATVARSSPDGFAAREPLDRLTDGFRMVAIDSRVPGSAGLSALCAGSIIVVRAGHTRAARIKAAEREIASAGGRVIGTILSEAPRPLPRWIERLCGL